MEPIQAPDYRDIVQVSDPQLSPDGSQVAFVRKDPADEEQYESTVYVVRVDGETEPRQFTVAEGVDAEPRWSPSGDRLAFVSTRGADDDRPQLWVLPTGGGEARQVTDVPGGVSQLAWSPDGSRIAFVQSTTAAEREEGLDLDIADEEEYEREDPDPRVIDRLIYRAGERYFDGSRSHVYLVDLGDDAVERVTDGDEDYGTPAWSDAATLYYTGRLTGDPDDNIVFDILARDIDSGETTAVTQTTGWVASLEVTADDRIAHPYTPEDRATLRQTEVEVYDVDRGESVTLTADLDRTVDPQSLTWDPAEEQVYFVTPDEGDYVVRRVAGDGSADPEVVVESGHVTGVSVGEEAVAVTKSEWDHRGDVFLTVDGAETRLTEVNAEYLAERTVREPEEIRFESDGHELQGWVLTPPGFDESKTYPLAVEIHGGPHSMWSTSGTMWHEFQTLAARGYVVFWSNPRGSTGYGEDVMADIERDWGSVTMRDVMAGVEAVASREYVDEDNAFVTGGSFGGYMTGWIVGHTDFFEGAVAQRGVYDFASFYGSTDAFKLLEWDYGTEPWEEPGFFWEESPVAHADEVTTPTLVVHADNDFRVPVNNGEMFYLFLRKNGVDTRLVRYPREGHELSRSGEPGHVVNRVERIVRWFDGYNEHVDVPPALERGDEGLSAAADEDDEDDAGDGDD